MESFEPKKTALIRIWQILKDNSDFEHPLTQEEIAKHLERDYGIVLERKAIGRNISLLKEMEVDIESKHGGSYLAHRDFEDSELRLLIDGVLCSKHITARYSDDLINRLCGLSNKYFRSHIQNIHSVNDWSKSDNQELFYNIELIDRAISENKKIKYDYNKYGVDKNLHKTSEQEVSPYQLILHNQRYYLMAYCEYWEHIVYHRLDRMKNMEILEDKATNIRSIPGHEGGIEYKQFATAMPYMYSDEPELIKFTADTSVVDQIVDWFGTDINIILDKNNGNRITVYLKASPNAMKYWSLQYLDHVEILSPASLRDSIKKSLESGAEKYR